MEAWLGVVLALLIFNHLHSGFETAKIFGPLDDYSREDCWRAATRSNESSANLSITERISTSRGEQKNRKVFCIRWKEGAGGSWMRPKKLIWSNWTLEWSIASMLEAILFGRRDDITLGEVCTDTQ